MRRHQSHSNRYLAHMISRPIEMVDWCMFQLDMEDMSSYQFDSDRNRPGMDGM